MMIKKIVVAGRWCCCTVHVTKESLILTGLAINDGCRSEDRKVRLATRTIHCWCWCSGWPTITINSAKCIDRLILLTRMVKKHRRKVRKEWTQCNCFRNLIWLKRPHLMRRDVRCDWRRFYFALVQIWWQEKSQSSSVQLYGTCSPRVLLFLLEDELVGKLGGVIDPIEDLSAHVVAYYYF